VASSISVKALGVRNVVDALTACAALSGCGGNDAPGGPASAEITVTQASSDSAYEVRSVGQVTNEDYGDAYGVVVVQARRGESTSSRGPALSGTLRLQDGSKVEREKFRSTIWSDFEEYEDFELKCDTVLDLAAVESITVR